MLMAEEAEDHRDNSPQSARGIGRLTLIAEAVADNKNKDRQ